MTTDVMTAKTRLGDVDFELLMLCPPLEALERLRRWGKDGYELSEDGRARSRLQELPVHFTRKAKESLLSGLDDAFGAWDSCLEGLVRPNLIYLGCLYHL